MIKNHKLLIAIVLISVISVCICSCKSQNEKSDTSASDIIEENDESLSDNATQLVTPATDSNESSMSDDNTGCAVITTREYRACWYDVPSFFGELIDEDEYAAWEEEYVERYSNKDPQIMMMIEFIEHFNISREDFDKANLKYAKWISKDRKPLMNPKDYPDQEMCEIYNGDLIYSFDNERINEYYLSIRDYPFEYSIEYEQAVDAGEYTSQTTDWINVDRMEADIVAKYGSVD